MHHNFPKIYRLIVILSDLATVPLAYFLAIYLRNLFLSEEFTRVRILDFPILFMSMIGIWWLLLVVFDALERRRFSSLREELRIGVASTLIGVAFIFSTGFLTKEYYPRSIIVFFSICFLTLWILQKVIGFQISLRVREGRRVPILIVGAGDRAIDFSKTILKAKGIGFKIIGFLDARKDAIGKRILGNHHIIGTFNQLQEILRSYQVEEVFFVLEPRHFGFLDGLMTVCADVGTDSHFIYGSRNLSLYKPFPGSVGDVPCISFSCLPHKEGELFIKRLIDIVVSALLLVVLSPLFLVIAILIKGTSKGPVFFPWKVVGANNRDFVGYKFRTMGENAEELKPSVAEMNEMNGPVFKIKNDPRITPVGKWLRKFSLDELPQLWSVLKGDMSLVGPRPPFRHELARYEFWQRRKISFKPGITCLWQVRGRNQICDFNDWCRLDLEYIDNWSLWLDFKILVKTAWAVMRGTGC